MAKLTWTWLGATTVEEKEYEDAVWVVPGGDARLCCPGGQVCQCGVGGLGALAPNHMKDAHVITLRILNADAVVYLNHTCPPVPLDHPCRSCWLCDAGMQQRLVS
uniref:Uncharacterized protein n=1 Tax=Oryza meridionalis TaxID=40149 RepID=A0A0E0EQ43_9ORYZ